MINYKINHTEELNEHFVEKIQTNMPNIVYVYSQNSALSFLNLIKKYKLNHLWMNTNLMCISEKNLISIERNQMEKNFYF